MRRVIITTGTTLAGIVLLLSFKPHDSTAQNLSAPLSTGDNPSARSSNGSSTNSFSDDSDNEGSDGSSTRSTKPSTRSGTKTSKSTSSTSKSGTFIGSAYQTNWGNVQVKITVANGKLAKVNVLQHPTRGGHSIELANYALPQLIQESLSAGNAHIDTVSGATFTSEAYIESLQSALDKAGV